MYVEIEDQKSYGTEKGRELCSPFALVPPHQGNRMLCCTQPSLRLTMACLAGICNFSLVDIKSFKPWWAQGRKLSFGRIRSLENSCLGTGGVG